MKKVLAFLLVLAVIWAIPPVRAALMEKLHPVFAKLGPVGEKAATPMRRYTARTQINAVLTNLKQRSEEGRQVPTVQEFPRFLRDHPPSDKRDLDPWGTAYFMSKTGRTITIGSAGPDGVRGNADDITKSATL